MMTDAYGNYTPGLDSTSVHFGAGDTGNVASGTGDPNTQTLSDTVLFFSQFDGSGVFIETWVRKNASSPWV